MQNKKITFTKLVASGNDFVLIDCRKHAETTSYLKQLAKKVCHRQYGAGADGLLAASAVSGADIKMRIFNPDGSEAEMCGNGARCFAWWFARSSARTRREARIRTKAGDIVASIVSGDDTTADVQIRMSDPQRFRFDIPLSVEGRSIRAQFVNTGVPHTVILVEGLAKIDVQHIGRAIRYHKEFAPAGTNVNFVEIQGPNRISVRTYERGVEAETLACGTGSVASALVCALKNIWGPVKEQTTINVRTASGETVQVRFHHKNGTIDAVWLIGKTQIIYKGELYV